MNTQSGQIVVKQDSSPAFEKVTVTQFEKPRHGEKMRFEANLVAESLEGNHSAEEIQQLATESENACMAMQGIMNATPANTKLYLNGTEL